MKDVFADLVVRTDEHVGAVPARNRGFELRDVRLVRNEERRDVDVTLALEGLDRRLERLLFAAPRRVPKRNSVRRLRAAVRERDNRNEQREKDGLLVWGAAPSPAASPHVAARRGSPGLLLWGAAPTPRPAPTSLRDAVPLAFLFGALPQAPRPAPTSLRDAVPLAFFFGALPQAPRPAPTSLRDAVPLAFFFGALPQAGTASPHVAARRGSPGLFCAHRDCSVFASKRWIEVPVGLPPRRGFMRPLTPTRVAASRRADGGPATNGASRARTPPSRALRRSRPSAGRSCVRLWKATYRAAARR